MNNVEDEHHAPLPCPRTVEMLPKSPGQDTLGQEVQLSSVPNNSLSKRSISGLLGYALPVPTARGYINPPIKGSLYAPEGLRSFVWVTGHNINHTILTRHPAHVRPSALWEEHG